MEELVKLIKDSFNAQCRYVIPRIYNKSEREDFDILYKIISNKMSNSDIPLSCNEITETIYFANEKVKLNQKSINMILSIYQETYINLHSRFVTGNPLESNWITF